MTDTTVLDTERLTLRPLAASDAPFVLALLTDPSFLHFVGDRGVHTLADAESYVEKGPSAASRARIGIGMFVVTTKPEGTPVGICGLLARDALDDVDLGYAFLPAYWSRGYATESAAAVLAHARRDLGLGRIVAITSPDNDASIRVLEKLGFRFERVTKLSEDAHEVKLFALD